MIHLLMDPHFLLISQFLDEQPFLPFTHVSNAF